MFGMGTYKIQLILDGKSEIQKMMSQAAGSVKSGLDTIKKESGSADASLRKMGKSGNQAGSDINKGTTKATSGFSKLKSQSASTFSTITAGASKTSTTISTGFSKATSTATAGLSKMGSVGKSALTGIGGSAKSAIDGLDTLEMGIGAVIGGFGVMEIAGASWSGATQREFNEVYLGTKMTADETERYLGTIEKIVSQVPGDDTFMNALLTSAVARETSLTVEQLEMLGTATAEYVFVSQQVMGGLNAEYQREIKDYILTGNTGLMVRDGLLKNQMDILEGKSTVEERILAINQALQEEGYGTLTTTEQTAIKAEELKGRFQLAATEVGTRVLPYVEKLLDFFIAMDEKTNGMSTQIMLMAGGVIALGSVLGFVLKPLSTAVDKAKDLVGWFKDKLPGTKTVRVKCVKDPSCTTSDGGVVGGTSTKSKISNTVSSILSSLGLTGAVAGTGQSVGLLGTASSLGLGMLGGIAGAAGGYGVQNIGNWFKSQFPKGSAGQLVSGNMANILGVMSGPLAPFISKGGSWAGGTDLYDPMRWVNLDWGKAWKGNSDYLGKLFKNPLPSAKAPDSMKSDAKPFWESWFPKSSDKQKTPSTGSGGKTPVAGIGMGLLTGIPDLVKNLDIPKFKWPSIGEISKGIKEKFPKINWKLPSASQIIQQVKTKIPGLKWKIPNVSQLLNQTWQKIKTLVWNKPGISALLSQTWQKITKLVWKIPGLGAILNVIKSKIPGFNWPMGPGGKAFSGAVSTGFKAFGPPSGPIKDTIASTMSQKSGVGQGYIQSAMARNFQGVNAFNSIADGMADHLGYKFYFGDQKTNQQVWDSGLCNCYDGAQFLMSEASQRFGLSAGLSNGKWDGTGIAHTWSTIGGRPFDMAAKLIRGQWNPPSGPGSFEQFMTDIGPGLEYIGYGGHQQNPYDAVSTGGNCFDMTMGILGIASELYGRPGKMVWGHYNGQSHVWARIGNRDYDPSRMALEHTYNPPPQGPGSARGPVSGDTFIVQYSGTVYGVEDLDNRTKQMVDSALEKREKKRQRYRMGG